MSQAPSRFNPGWKLTLFTGLLLPLLLVLGNWQLNRAQEKANVLAQQEALRVLPPQRLSEVGAANYASHLPVRLSGQYLAGLNLLLDNQHYQSRLGYEVLTPFRDELSGSLVLISRGWIAGSPDRAILPTIEEIPGSLELAGEIYIPLGKAFLLAEQQWTDSWPKVIQAIDIDLIGGVLGETVFPYVVRISESSPGALQRHWLVVNVAPEKHTAYAVQWFALAAALSLLYILAGLGIPGRKSKS